MFTLFTLTSYPAAFSTTATLETASSSAFSVSWHLPQTVVSRYRKSILIGFFGCGWQQFSEEQQHLLIFITPLTTICVISANTIFFIGCDHAKKLLCFADSLRIQRVVRPFTLVSSCDQTALT
jgi:hypothetical protein